ncbi:MAG: DUF1559 domain-containing protein [Thermoguttaceae bacterium]|nr:DUF1559 domain-containing protein [Thermoguttaceae bacterium]
MRRNLLAVLAPVFLGAAIFAAPTLAPSAFAQDAKQPSAATAAAPSADDVYARIAPYVDAETFAVARLDLASLDLAAVAKTLNDAFAKTPQNADPDAAQAFQTGLDGLVRALDDLRREALGSGELFVVVPRSNAPQFFAILAVDEAKRDAVAKELAYLTSPLKPFEIDGGLAFGTPNFDAEYFANFQAAPNPKTQALLNGSTATAQLCVGRVDAETAKSVARFLGGFPDLASSVEKRFPELAAALDDGLNDGFDAASLELDANRLRLVFRANFPSEDAARAFAKTVRAATVDGARATLERDLVPLVLAQIQEAGQSFRREQAFQHLKQLALATQNFLDANGGALPARYSVDADGKPLHSWRVFLLPFIEQNELYQQIRLDEPWDSEHNRQFHSQTPALFQRPGASEVGCVYVCVADATAALQPAKEPDSQLGVRLAAITDGTSNTLLFVERKEPVCWMDPNADLTLDEFLATVADAPDAVPVVFVDGRASLLPTATEPSRLKAYVTRGSGEEVPQPR